MLRREDGFTLIELIAVMIILGVISFLVIPRFTQFGNTATERVIDLAIDELNTREEMIWHNVKLEGYTGDDVESEVYLRRDWDIGNGTTVNETSITVRGTSAAVHRDPATMQKPAIWARN